ncbi:MAG TPA: hypothetical protein VND96_11485 [Candidatus Micrarchaeaceae archaeon]|nr:hypothetical protein [Candidatus Micrarchaeaceae archaeon]
MRAAEEIEMKVVTSLRHLDICQPVGDRCYAVELCGPGPAIR